MLYMNSNMVHMIGHIIIVTLIISVLLISYVQTQNEGQVRLTNNINGLLEVYYDGEWGYVCDDGWIDINGQVVCGILGYDYVSSNQFAYSSDLNYRLNFINCMGGEQTLLDCSYGNYTPNYCDSNEHVYVSCQYKDGNVRLTKGTTGLLEVYYDGQWGYVCDDGWIEINGLVVCDILGYKYVSSNRYSYSSDLNYNLNLINCMGGEKNLLDCSYEDYTPGYCGSYEHVYISCQHEGQVRLTNGTTGLLEVFYDGQWGYVCDDGWIEINGLVVCDILGYKYVTSNVYSYSSDLNYRLNFINCMGGEQTLLDCSYGNYTPNYCGNYEHVYINCLDEGHLRLTNGTTGLLEVFYDGQWSYVCDDGWIEINGLVVCDILGYEYVSSNPGSYSSDLNYRLSYINCMGGEQTLLDCFHRVNTPSNCGSQEHVYISCQPEEGQIRLTNVTNGLLEVYYDGEWGYVCDDEWIEINGQVVCDILGYEYVSSNPGSYSSDLNYRLNYISCMGGEQILLDCSYRSYTPNYCSSQDHVYISCLDEEGQVRLTNGTTGLLEVYYDGQWGYVCDDGWIEINGQVVCDILGYEYASSNLGSYSSDLNYRLSYINCMGGEQTLLDCSYGNFTPKFCSSQDHVYISCLDEGQVRLTNGTSGLLEVYYDGEWGYVCDDYWIEINGQVVCGILGYDYASSNPGSYSSDLNYRLNYINCMGGEQTLLDCSYRNFTPNYCGSQNHVYIRCLDDTATIRVYYQGFNMTFSDVNNPVFPSVQEVPILTGTKYIVLTCNLPECIWKISNEPDTLTGDSFIIPEIYDSYNRTFSLMRMASNSVSYTTAHVHIHAQVVVQSSSSNVWVAVVIIVLVLLIILATIAIFVSLFVCFCVKRRNTTKLKSRKPSVINKDGRPGYENLTEIIPSSKEYIDLSILSDPHYTTINETSMIPLESVNKQRQKGNQYIASELSNTQSNKENNETLEVNNKLNLFSQQREDIPMFSAKAEKMFVSKSIPKDEFRVTYQQRVASGIDENSLFSVEFTNMNEDERMNIMLETEEALKVENTSKNPIKHIVPFDENRVVLMSTYFNSDYINASWLENSQFIASIHPTKETQRDFFQMIYQTEACMVIMLTTRKEKAKMMGGVSNRIRYWPTKDEPIDLEPFVSTLINHTESNAFIRQEISLENTLEGKNHTFTQIISPIWNEDSTVADMSSAVNLLSRILKQLQDNPTKSIIIHCEDGISKTGIILTAINAVKEMTLKKTINISNTVKNLRRQRMKTVPTLACYTTCYSLMNEYCSIHL